MRGMFSGVIRTMGRQERLVRVKIFPNAGSTPSWTSQGGIDDVALTSAGKFTITGKHHFKRLVGFQATYVDEQDNVDLYAQGGAVSNLGTNSAWTAVVKLKTGATNTNNAGSGTNRYISVDLAFEETQEPS